MNQTLELRPLGLGELLDRAIRLYRHKFLDFIGIIAIVQVPLTLLSLLLTLATNANLLRAEVPVARYDELIPTLLSSYGVSFVVGILSMILLQGIATAAMTRAIADIYMGRETNLVDAYRRVGPSWKSLVGAIFLAMLIIFGLALLLMIPCLGWIAAGGPLVFLGACVMPLIAPVVVLEKLGARSAIRRAWELARRRFWWVLGFMGILYLLSMLISAGPVYGINALLQTLLKGQTSYGNQVMIQTVLQSLTTMLTGLLYYPLHLTAVTLLYFDLRVRTEGFDLAILSSNESIEGIDTTTLTSQAPTVTTTQWITKKEIGYLALVSLGAIVLFGILYGIILGIAMATMPML